MTLFVVSSVASHWELAKQAFGLGKSQNLQTITKSNVLLLYYFIIFKIYNVFFLLKN